MTFFQEITFWIYTHATPSNSRRPRAPKNSNKSDVDSFSSSFHHVSRRPYSRWRYLVCNLLALLVSALMIITIALFLRLYDDQPAPSWRYAAITLNSVISWLGVVGKLAVMIPISECIGQVKWILFSKGRRKVSELDIIDGAGRNALGAVGWIFRFRGGILVHLGAALVIASLGFEPALQQLVVYEQRSVVDPLQTALVAKNTDYRPVRGFNEGLIFATPRALLSGAYSSVLGQGVVVPEYTCPSSNCTFPETTSVGVCSTCSEITNNISRNCTTLTKDRPFKQGRFVFSSNQLCTYSHNNISVGGGNTYLNLNAKPGLSSTSGDGKVSISSKRIDLTALYIQPGGETSKPAGFDPAQLEKALSLAPGFVVRDHQARGFQCGISYCEKTYRNGVRNGQYYETLVLTSQKDAFVLPIPGLEAISDALLNQPQNISDDKKTTLTTAALFGMSNGLSLSLTGNSTVISNGSPDPGQVSEFHRAIYQNLLGQNFSQIMDTMGSSMSNAVRNDGTKASWANGEVFVDRVYVRVRWNWFAWPAAVWTLALLLLIVVSVQSRNTRMGWLGNSQVASLFFGLEGEVRRDVDVQLGGGWGDDKAMRSVGEKVKLRLATLRADGEFEKLRFAKFNSPGF